jgi:hypothetical protein
MQTDTQAKLYVDQGALDPDMVADINDQLAEGGTAKFLGETWERDAAGLFIASDIKALREGRKHCFDDLPISGVTIDTPAGPVLTSSWWEALASYDQAHQPGETAYGESHAHQ